MDKATEVDKSNNLNSQSQSHVSPQFDSPLGQANHNIYTVWQFAESSKP